MGLEVLPRLTDGAYDLVLVQEDEKVFEQLRGQGFVGAVSGASCSLSWPSWRASWRAGATAGGAQLVQRAAAGLLDRTERDGSGAASPAR